MKKIIALDISTKPGWAKFIDDKLVEYGTLFPSKSVKDFGTYPFNYLKFSQEVVSGIVNLIKDEDQQVPVIIEETTASRQNYSQKIIEWVHYGIVKWLMENGRNNVFYIRTGVWRKAVGASQNAEERKHNATVKKIKKSTGAKLAKIDGKVVGKLTKKHYSLRAFEEHFGKEIRLKDEDAAEAALIGLAYIKGVNCCDGTVTGGLHGNNK